MPAPGMPVGSASRSVIWRSRPSGSRRLPASRSRSRSLLASVGARFVGRRSSAGSSGGGSGASRSKSRNCSDSFTLLSPSVIVWCSFSISADLPPRSPSTMHELPQRARAVERIGGDQAGQVEQLAHRARLREARCGARGSRGRSWGRRPTSARSGWPGPAAPAGASRGTTMHGALHATPAAGRSRAGGRGS